MSPAAADIIATGMIKLNAGWRVRVGQPAGTRKAWVLEQLDGDEWQGRAIVRSSPMLREMIGSWCGRLSPGVPAILAGLRKRIDIDYED
jgi:hypothetical protein